MADIDLDVVRRDFADLTGLFKDAAPVAAAGQGIKSLSTAMHRIRRRLIILEERLQ